MINPQDLYHKVHDNDDVYPQKMMIEIHNINHNVIHDSRVLIYDDNDCDQRQL